MKVVRKIAGFCTDFRRDGLLLLPGYHDSGSSAPGVPRGCFYCSDDGLNVAVCRCTLYDTDSLLNAAPEKNRSLDQPLYDDYNADQQCSAAAWCPSVYTALGADLTALYRFNLIDLGFAFYPHSGWYGVIRRRKRWLSDKDFGLRRAVKAENNI